MNDSIRSLKLAVCCTGLLVLLAAPAMAQECTCDNTDAGICSGQGFEITLVGYQVDQQAGVSTWDYEVCNDKNQDFDCVPPKDLSHVDINLPGLGSCLTPDQQITLAQVGGFDVVTVSCGVAPKDPSCDLFGDTGLDFVAKCDVSGDSNLDPGECFVMRLTIAGEQPGLGAGAAMTVTKAGPGCVGDCILGPSCDPCEPPPSDECLTRTPGFWGTHPHITGLFLPVTVCGETLAATDAGSCDSVTEALCVSPGQESRNNRAYAQLVRQLTAAKLNLAATAANFGSCSATGIEARITACEALCGASQKVISGSGCIEDLAAFNESLDSFEITPAPFDHPGPALPGECQEANGNGIVIGRGGC